MAKNDTSALPYREMTIAALVFGIIQGCVMTMAFVYAGLMLGFTLPGSTIAAIMGFAILKGVLRKGTIVENNVNQTVASGINISSAGIVFTLPVFYLMMKDFNPVYIAMAAIGGSFLGVAVIIPLRKQMIDFDRLRFPSGTAVGAILKSPGAGREKAMLLGAGFLCSMFLVISKKMEILPEEFAFSSIGIHFPEYTQTAIYLSLMNIGAGLLAGRGGLPFFFGGCLAFWLVAPVGVHMGLSHGIPEAEVTGFVYKAWIRPIGIGMLIGGALMGVVMAFPSIKSAMKSLARASKLGRGKGNDELSIKIIIGGFIGVFVLLFFGAWLGVQDESMSFDKNSFVKEQFQPFIKKIDNTVAGKYVFSFFSENTQLKAGEKLAQFEKEQKEQKQKKEGRLSEDAKKIFEEKQKREAHNYWRKLQQSTIRDLNTLLDKKDFYSKAHFAEIEFSEEVKNMAQKHESQTLEGSELNKFNRRLLETVFPDAIRAVPAEAKSNDIRFGKALFIALIAALWLALAGIIVAQCTGMTDISPLSGLALIAVTLILGLSGNNVIAAVLLGVAVCVATAQCADMMQDLKTGYMVGGIPKRQQYAQMAVAWLGPIIAMITLYILDQGQGFGPGTKLPAPQAGALQGTIEAVVSGQVPLDKYLCGGLLGGLLSVLPGGGIGVLVGLAMYLPFSITFGYGIGCFLNMGLCRLKGNSWTEDKIVPLAAGFIVGEAMTELAYSLQRIISG